MVKLITDWERSSEGAGMVSNHEDNNDTIMTENHWNMSSLMEMIESLS